MAQDSGYPDNLLATDVLNTLNGGAPDGALDSDQLKYVNGLLRALAARKVCTILINGTPTTAIMTYSAHHSVPKHIGRSVA